MPQPPLQYGPLDALVGYQLRRAFLRSNKLFAKLAGEAGVAPGQYGVLKLIGLNPGRTQGEIAQASGLDPSSLTPLLDQLAKAGLVERRPGRDRRASSLHLTERGEAVTEQTEARVAEHEAAIRANLSEREAKTLAALLKQIEG